MGYEKVAVMAKTRAERMARIGIIMIDSTDEGLLWY